MPIDCPSLSAICAFLSGSAGTTTATGNQHARYCITRPTPIDPATGSQLILRNAMTFCSNLWKNATPAQRANWHRYADSVPVRTRLNPRTYLSGREHWLRSSVIRRANSITVTMVRRPALSKCGFRPPSFVQDPDEPFQWQIHFDDTAPWCSEASAAMLIRWSQPINVARTWYDRQHSGRHNILGNPFNPPTSPRDLIDVPAVLNKNISFTVRVTRFDHRLSSRFLTLVPTVTFP